MRIRVTILLLFLFIPFAIIRSQTDSQDVNALMSLKRMWKNVPPSWNHGNDSCGDQWEGIACRDSRVISIMLSSMGLVGLLPDDIQRLSELETLDLSYNKGLTGSLPPAIGNLANLDTLILAGCNFNGELPYNIGSLSKLRLLSLNSNGFSGPIPQTLGNLSEVHLLDFAANRLTGNIPVSNGITPGLDMLVHAKLLNFGGNQLSGEIPPQLFNENMNLRHLLLDNNQFSGTIPTTLCLVRTLETLRFDGNAFIGSVPSSINTLIRLKTMIFSNNKLGGRMPDLTGMNHLSYLDMSNNSFEVSDLPPWITALPALTTLMMEQCQIHGMIPKVIFNVPLLQKVVLKNNKLSGMLDIGAVRSAQLQFVDLQNNMISGYIQRPADKSLQLILVGNSVCGTILTEQNPSCVLPESNPSYSTPRNCKGVRCTSGKTSSPSCHCSYPYSGTLTFLAPQFSGLENFRKYAAALERALLSDFSSKNIPVESVSVSNIYRDALNNLHITLRIFPLGQCRFSRKTILMVGFMLSSQKFKLPSYYGPATFLPVEYTAFLDGSESESGSESAFNHVLVIIIEVFALVFGSIVSVTGAILASLGIQQLCTKCSCSCCNNWFHCNNNTTAEQSVGLQVPRIHNTVSTRVAAKPTAFSICQKLPNMGLQQRQLHHLYVKSYRTCLKITLSKIAWLLVVVDK